VFVYVYLPNRYVQQILHIIAFRAVLLLLLLQGNVPFAGHEIGMK